MFTRIKNSGRHRYVQVVENRREEGKTRQRVLGTLGRLDRLQASGALDGLLHSLAGFTERSIVLSTARRRLGAGGEEPGAGMPTRQIGPALVFDRLWRETGCREVIAGLAQGRRHGFDLERVVFFSVLHRLMQAGSDRRAEQWGHTQKIRGLAPPPLQHLYRAMAWLGEELPAVEQGGRTRAPRCVKDLVEERLFLRRRSLFSRLDLVFFDTTSLSFYGAGGEELGRRGHSKDKRPDLKQMVLGMVLDETGTPVCVEMWPGNATDVKSLVPVAERLGSRFGVGSVCLVADQGMTSREVMREIERRGWKYVLGARMRTVKEVREQVLTDGGAFAEVPVPEGSGRERLEAKAVVVPDEKGGDRRYVVCRSEARTERDRRARAEMLEKLAAKLRSGAKGLLANRGYARYLTAEKKALRIDPKKTAAEEQYDGMWVLTTNAGLSAAATALRYKELWRVERMFRAAKSELKTRPAFHRTDAGIRGHVFCTFLALVLRRELARRLEAARKQEAAKAATEADKQKEGAEAGEQAEAEAKVEWQDVVADLAALTEGVIEQGGKRFVVRSEARGVTVPVFRSVGLALPPAVRQEEMRTPVP